MASYSRTLKEALWYQARGLSVVPISPRSKSPPKGFSLSAYFGRRATADELTGWFTDNPSSNVAMITGAVSGVVVVDADSEHDSEVLKRRLPKTSMTKTPNGRHYFFRMRPGQQVHPRVGATVLGVECDIRGENSYVMVAPSVHPSGAVYRREGPWDFLELPEFDASWIEKQNRCVAASVSQVQYPISYIQKIKAISGERGHNKTFRVACILRDAGLRPEEALAALVEWNRTNALPPFTTKELLHKVNSAFAGIEK